MCHQQLVNSVCVVSCVLVVMVLIQADQAHSRAVPPTHTKLSVVMNTHKLHQADAEDFDAETADVRERSRREAADFDDSDLDSILAEADKAAAGDSPRHHLSRNRRSAAWWLSATIQMCNKSQHLCRHIEVMEGNTRVEIRLESE